MPTPAQFHLLIERLSAQNPLFHITPKVMAQAMRASPALADQIHLTYGVDGADFDRQMRQADGLIGWRFPREDLSARAPRLRWIQLTGSGFEQLQPLDWLPKGVMLSNNRGVHAHKAGEFATMALLMLNCRMPVMTANQRAAHWQQIFTPSIAGKTLVVLGVGNMGGAVARAGRRLGMHVIGIRRTGTSHPAVHEMRPLAELREILPRADILAITAPLTEATRGLIGAPELARLRPDAAVLNIGRGAVLDSAALAAMLRAGKLSCAMLDVFDPEPLPADSELWSTPGLLVTPHCSSDDQAAYARKTAELALRSVARMIAGKRPLNLVRRGRSY